MTTTNTTLYRIKLIPMGWWNSVASSHDVVSRYWHRTVSSSLLLCPSYVKSTSIGAVHLKQEMYRGQYQSDIYHQTNLTEGSLSFSYIICPCHCLVVESSMKGVKAKVVSVSVNVSTRLPVGPINNGTGAVFRNPITPSPRMPTRLKVELLMVKQPVVHASTLPRALCARCELQAKVCQRVCVFLHSWH